MNFLRLLSPRIHCVFCGAEVDPAANCVCEKCALPIVPVKLQGEVSVIAPFEYREPVSTLIRKYKYNNNRYIAQYLSSCMAGVVSVPENTVVIPVPLHKKRLRERGFNQSALLARSIAKIHGLDYNPKLLSRIVYTQQMTALNPLQRRQNVQGAFAASYCERALLVDDVCTTGSTLNAAAGALKSAGCKNVYAVTAACVVHTCVKGQ